MMLDSTDIQLLALLQRNGAISSIELSEKLNLSASQVGRRKQRLEAGGFIEGIVCRLNPERLGLNVQAIIQIHTASQTNETHHAIQLLVNKHPEIMSAWTLTGEADYIFRVYCSDLNALNRLVQDILLPHPFIGKVQSQIVMEQMKDDTALPLPRPSTF